MIPVASDVHKGRCWMAMIPPGEDVENAGADRVHAGSVAAALGGAAAGSGDRSGSFHQRLFRDERAGGGGMAGASALGAHGGDRQFAQAEVGPAGHAAIGEETGGAGGGTAPGGLVSAPSHPGVAPAGAAALRHRAAAGADEKPRE